MSEPQVEPQFKPGERVFSHYTAHPSAGVSGWMTVERISHRGTDADGVEYTTWYDLRTDEGKRELLDDHNGNWELARIMPPRIARRYGYGDDPKCSS